MIAYEIGGSVFALTDGSELLLHDGESEGPLWRVTLDSKIVGVGIDAQQVVAVTESGTVSWFAARTQSPAKKTAQLGAQVRTACVDVTNDRVVAITAHGVVRHTRGTTEPIGEEGATCVALAPTGAVLFASPSHVVLLGVGGDRKVTAFDGVRAVAWHPGANLWLLGIEAKVYKWDGTNEIAHVTNLPAGSKLDSVAASARAIAIGWNRNMAVALAWPSRDTLGSVQYFDREVDGMAFGPWPWLGVALDSGDGNKFNLESAALHRSDTHPGREHHRWMVNVGGASRPTQPAAPAPAAPVQRAPAPVTPEPAKSGGVPMVVFVIIAAIAFVLRLAMRS